MSHYVYIIQSLKDERFYIGETSNVEDRLLFHNAGKQRSTRNRIPFQLILTEEYLTRADALKREKQIKSWKAAMKAPTDTIYCCVNSIAALERASKIRGTGYMNFFGSLGYTKHDLAKWHAWKKNKLK
jgi:putative endonuclease